MKIIEPARGKRNLGLNHDECVQSGYYGASQYCRNDAQWKQRQEPQYQHKIHCGVSSLDAEGCLDPKQSNRDIEAKAKRNGKDGNIKLTMPFGEFLEASE